ncbi:hypothetical protein FHR56_003331 [Xanthomonas sacchari]|uniref:hypothetical protein n=1 Tax=unclassified Xanthomonas TaxID=2643310 RepID=UPI001371694D|nr:MULTISPECIES: hypothetical protein [unclassified Xanthomonas]MBB6368166.1 hypothetical protein [Xanthomonas sp. F10]MXV31880.1 hypothetical protein [Xanthomonas sp. LMG 8989]
MNENAINAGNDASLMARVERLEQQLQAKDQRLRRAVTVNRVLLFGVAALVVASAGAITSVGEQLSQYMDFSSTPVSTPALDTSVRWGRRDASNVGPGYTNEILSLISESDQQNSFSWPLYIQLNATKHPNATQDSSQSVGATVRAFQRSTGSPWLAGFHSELFHGYDGIAGQNVATHGTSILFNGELTSYTNGGSTIGLNLLNTPGSSTAGTHAIQIQPGTRGWQNGIHFDSGALGNIGINFDQSNYNMGIDLGDNSLRMNANQRIILEKYGSVYLRYNSTSDKVELVKKGSVVASW